MSEPRALLEAGPPVSLKPVPRDESPHGPHTPPAPAGDPAFRLAVWDDLNQAATLATTVVRDGAWLLLYQPGTAPPLLRQAADVTWVEALPEA